MFAETVQAHGAEPGEWTLLRADGSQLVANMLVTAMLDEQGLWVGYLAICIDVTERRRVHEALAARDRLLEKLSAEVPGGIADLIQRLRALGAREAEEIAARFPVLSFASGPTNSMRGAAFLSRIRALTDSYGGRFTVAEVGGALRVSLEVIDPTSGVTVYSESADAGGRDRTGFHGSWRNRSTRKSTSRRMRRGVWDR